VWRRHGLAVQGNAAVASKIVQLRPRHDEGVQVIIGQDRADRVDPRTTVGSDGCEEAEADSEVVEEPAPDFRDVRAH